MSWLEDFGMDAIIEETSRQSDLYAYAASMDIKELAMYLKKCDLVNDKWEKMKIDIINKAIKGVKLSDKQKNVLYNVYSHLQGEL
jgi:hypothetical protein